MLTAKGCRSKSTTEKPYKAGSRRVTGRSFQFVPVEYLDSIYISQQWRVSALRECCRPRTLTPAVVSRILTGLSHIDMAHCLCCWPQSPAPPEQIPWSSLAVNHSVNLGCLALLKALEGKRASIRQDIPKAYLPGSGGKGQSFLWTRLILSCMEGLRVGCPIWGDSVNLDTVGMCMSYLENIVVTAIWPCTWEYELLEARPPGFISQLSRASCRICGSYIICHLYVHSKGSNTYNISLLWGLEGYHIKHLEYAMTHSKWCRNRSLFIHSLIVHSFLNINM